MVVGARQSFQFFSFSDKVPGFSKNSGALPKFLCGILHYLINIIKL